MSGAKKKPSRARSRRSTAPRPLAEHRRTAPPSERRPAPRADIARTRLVEEMRQRREDVMQAARELCASWVRIRHSDQQLAATEAALAEAHSRFGEFYDFVPAPFLVLDHGLRIVQINAAGSAFLDETFRFAGRPLGAYVATEDLRKLMAALTEAGIDEVRRLELRVRGRRGWTPAQLTAKVSERSQGAADSQRIYYVLLVDLSEIRRLEQEQRRSADAERAALAAARAKDEFIAMLSHELRTPLTPILAAADALGTAQLSGGVAEAVAIIRRNVVTEARLVDDLLEMARVAQKRLAVQRQPVSLHSLVSVVVADWAAEATRNGLTVRLELGARRDRIRADPGRIAQVLRNVLGNALKFSDSGGRVRVRTEDAAGNVRLCVDDTGRGMTPAEVARLFEPFSETRERFASRAGLGLGLVISHGIVEAHGGLIRARSAGLGRGTTIEIELPATDTPALELEDQAEPTPVLAAAGVQRRLDLADASSAGSGSAEASGPTASAPESAPPHEPGRSHRLETGTPGGAHRVLLVEDDADSAETLAMVLSMEGYEVVIAGSIEEARRLVAGCDLMVSDISLPDGSGLDLVKEVQRHHPLRALALSGYGTEEDRQRSHDAGFAEHLTKPVDIDHLLAAVQRLAGSASLPTR